MQEKKPVIYSGIQPSGIPTIGNYVGALRNWILLQDRYDCIYCVVDLHAITVRQEPKELRANTRRLAALLLACGVDPQKSILYVQSHVPAHAELAWMLGCYTYLGELSRMTQFKDKSSKNAENINAGLLTYPVLMAADILLYQADLVPVGQDQKQHLEITRDLAARFNGVYGQTFKVPEPYIPPVGARIRSLQEPERKMSKSDDETSYISLLDTPEAIVRKFKRAVTDSDTQVRFDEAQKPGVSNLMTILSVVGGDSIEAIRERFEGKGYGDFKLAVADAVVERLRPIQKRYAELMDERTELDRILADGAARARRIASRTLGKARRKIGFLDLE